MSGTTRRQKFVTRKYDGDDAYSWAVFRAKDVRGLPRQIFYGDATPIVSGLSKLEAIHHKRALESANQ